MQTDGLHLPNDLGQVTSRDLISDQEVHTWQERVQPTRYVVKPLHEACVRPPVGLPQQAG